MALELLNWTAEVLHNHAAILWFLVSSFVVFGLVTEEL